MNQKNIQTRRSSSKVLASTFGWSVFAFCLILGGLLFFPVKTQAALRSPVPITIGTQYSTVGAMGQETQQGWMDDNGSLRRSVYLQPKTGLHLLVVAYVNFNTCSGNLCDLEFKVTCYDDADKCANNGTNWTNALLGTAPHVYYRPAGTFPVSYPEFTLYVSPNNQDIWLSYKTDEYINSSPNELGCRNGTYNTPHMLKTVVIKKLKWNAANELVWYSSGENSPEQVVQNQTCNITTWTSESSEVGVAVQFYTQNGVTMERAWGIVIDTNTTTRNIKLAYSDNFSSTSTWVKLASTIATMPRVMSTDFNYAYRFSPSLPKTVFFPIGTTGDPGLILVRPRVVLWTQNNGCNEDYAGQGLSFLGIAQEGGTAWNYRYSGGSGGSPSADIISPNFQSFPYMWNTVGHAVCYDNTDTSGEVAYDFSVAVRPFSLTQSRVVIAFLGGRDNAVPPNKNLNTYIELKNCLASRLTSAPQSATISCANDSYFNSSLAQNIVEHFLLLDAPGGSIQTFRSPSVGFYGSNAVVAARNVSNGRLTVFQETAPHVDVSNNPSSNATWGDAGNWEKVLSHDAGLDNASGDSRNVSVPANVMDDVKVVTNSNIPPVAWNMTGVGQRIAFSTNMGGTLINTSGTPVQAAPVKGFGWASTFGWLALNCASVPGADCTPPNRLYGVGIGTAASAAPASLPPFSPSSATTTYPLGGYAYSDNLGFLSFERRDSAINCASPCESNLRGDPPGEAYHVSQAESNPIAMYDKSNQHIYGWGRFRNLCNFNTSTGKCQDKDGGWVRFRGYWTDPAPTRTKVARFSLSTQALVERTNCTAFPGSTPGNEVILRVDAEYVRIETCSAIGPDVELETTPLHNPSSYEYSTTVQNVTTQEYGVDAYWTGSNYEFSGWAWSDEMGWIRFNPLIFIGYAWMETLFGNIYSGSGVQLPDAVDPSGNRVNKCDTNNDGVFDEPCYVATYRIETDGSIQREIFYPGTAQAIPGATSAAPQLDSLALQLLNGVDRDAYNTQWESTSPIPFPSITSSTTVYRNFLGKIDLQALLTRVETSGRLLDVDGYPTPALSRDIDIGINRLGNTVYEMNYSTTDSSPADWKASELVAMDMDNSATSTHYILETQNSQVVHIPGNLTVDGANAKLVASGAIGNTFNVDNVSGSFPVCPTATTPACALVVDAGGDNEEYLAYTGYASGTFTGVSHISGASTHNPQEAVRWVWRLPYQAGETSAQSTTIVVDGNLDIQYNIIASTPTGAAKINDVPTIAFIVKGDVQVGVEVTKITGAFVVLSNKTINTDGTVALPDQTYNAGNGGSFFTSSDKAVCQLKTSDKLCRKLVIEGLLFARQFFFQRYGSLSLQVPGEQVIFDEKLFLNPPPGLEDVTKALPNPERQLP